MQYRRILIIIIFFVLYFCNPLFARENPFTNSPEITFARTAAIGGLHAALADDLTTIFNNPAGFRLVEPQFSVTEITLSLCGSAAELVDEVITGMGGVSTEYPYSVLSLLGPISLGFVGNGFGLGIFNTSTIRYGTWRGSSGITTAFEENIIFACGYAFRIPVPDKWNSTLDLGFLVRPFITTRSITNKNIQEIFESLSAPLELIIDRPFHLVYGAGIDLGVLYSYKETFSIGLVGRNLALAQGNYYNTFQGLLNGEEPSRSTLFFPLDLSFGMIWKLPLNRLGRYIQDLTLMLDYRDIFDFLIWPPTAINPLLHISIGCEFQLLEIISLRAGFYQCLPSAGIGIDLSLFTLNMAIFGLELSKKPWGWPIYNYILGLEFRY